MTATVLIVDDVKDNRILAAETLEDDAYELLEARDGVEAFDVAVERLPDLILMDVAMPRMSGIECLTRLKADDRTKDIPVILVTAFDADDDVVQGLNAGAIDHIAKPYSIDILSARVRTALALKHAHDCLERRNEEIMQLAFAMTHDLQTPLASLFGAITMLRRDGGEISNDGAKWMGRIEDSATRLSGMLEDLLVYAKAGSEVAQIEHVFISDTIRAVYEDLAVRAKEQGVKLTFAGETAGVAADPKLLYRIIGNLVNNALKFIDTEMGVVETSLEVNGSIVRLVVRDNGPGIPPHQLESVFQPFKRATAAKKGTGLGLSLVKKHVEAMRGRIWLESDGVSGTTAVLELPARSASPKDGRSHE